MGLNIIVCVKQVSTPNQDNAANHTISREKGTTNKLDLNALEEAVRIKERVDSSYITAISMGAKSAEKTVREAISMGVDRGILLNDIAFAGADTLATAYTLSQGIKKAGKFDLIICGKQSSDGETSQVGPSVAEKLSIPHIADVSEIINLTDKHIVCRRRLENGYQIIKAGLPALISVVKEINTPRIPKLKDVIQSSHHAVEIWTAKTLGGDKESYGAIGSPTQVIQVFELETDSSCEFIEGSISHKCDKIFEIIESMIK